MSTRNFLFVGVLVCLCFQTSSQAQTNVASELKKKTATEQAAKLQKSKAVPIDLTSKDLYYLASIDAIDHSNKHTPIEMKDFQVEAESEFNKNNIVLDWEEKIWHVIPRDEQLQPGEKKFKIEEGLVKLMNCAACQDHTFTIKEHTENTLILEVQPQDEGLFFVFSFNFKK